MLFLRWGGASESLIKQIQVEIESFGAKLECGPRCGCENAADAVFSTPLVPDYPLSYSLQSRSRESVSYADALAHPGPKHSDRFITTVLLLPYYYYKIADQ